MQLLKWGDRNATMYMKHHDKKTKQKANWAAFQRAATMLKYNKY